MKTLKTIQHTVGSPLVNMGAIKLRQPLPNKDIENVDPFLLLHYYSPYAIIKEKYVAISAELNEWSRRIWAASEANAIGYGGVSIVHKATNISRSTIHIGKKEISEGQLGTSSMIRKKGGGRKLLESQDSNSIGNPEDPLRWTTKSLRNITDAIVSKGFKISYGKFVFC